MVGQDPSTNQGAEITTWVVPVKIVLSDGSTWDPLSGGPSSPLARTILSPMFDSTTTYTQGGVDVGTTQYDDAFQRGNFWSIVQNNPNSHILLGGPTARISVLPELTLNVPSASGKQCTEFGVKLACVDINYYDNQVSAYMAASQTINPTGIPIFLLANMYRTEGGCCIGGYHSANGPQTYTTSPTSPRLASSRRTFRLCRTKLASGPTIRCIRTRTTLLAASSKSAIRWRTASPVILTAPGPIRCTASPITCRIWFSCGTSVVLSTLSVNDYWTFQGYTGITSICEDGS